MATNLFRGDAVDVRQVTTHTVGGTAANGQTYTITINTKSVTYTATGADTNTTIATALLALLQASTIKEFLEITWTSATTVITGTAVTAGKPTTITSGSSGTGTLVTATTTAASGKNFWSTAANWSLGSVPVSTDDVVIQNSKVDILYGLDQNAVALSSLTIAASYTGRIGLPDVTDTGYYEFRDKWLKIQSTVINIGTGVGSGSGRIKIDPTTSSATTINVYGTATPSDVNYYALMLKSGHSSSVINVTQGNIGIATEPGSTANYPVIRVGSEDSPSNDVLIYCGSGATLGTITQSGGRVTVNSNVTTWTKTGGTSEILGSATIGTLTQDGSQVAPAIHYWISTGTVTTGTFRGQGSVLDCSRDLRSRTATNLTVTNGAAFLDPYKTVTHTNPFATDTRSLNASNLGNAPFSLQRS